LYVPTGQEFEQIELINIKPEEQLRQFVFNPPKQFKQEESHF
jgi:hypothetical protein